MMLPLLRPPRLILALVAAATLTACASRPSAAPPADIPTVEDTEPLPAGIKPLTVEQEEAARQDAE